jgi:major membrane immunogen (membrane-anchored lipoprotein)
MASVEPHPTDEGKFQSAVDDYGHGPGNGKSRSAVYKHLKSLNSEEPETQPLQQEADFVQTDESEVPVETEDVEEAEEATSNGRTIPKQPLHPVPFLKPSRTWLEGRRR